ncbi:MULTISPECIES: radical SAM protein [Paenibacillus]|uniref:B12-binding domain-containing radical SAM protein n=1 Tax=Paenibacillus TaxID=44249 RepID=UPI0020B713DA|nr:MULTISPECIES: radical SAM protein [Paenibacillus]MCP3746813.1 B12-binding domain-containing radical SAM protein [Paenibacillus sp. A3M_27_13]
MKKVDVLFIHPRNCYNNYLMLPSLELCMMSSILNERGFSNYLIDCMINNIDSIQLYNHIKEFSPKIICIEGTAINHIEAIKAAQLAKKEFPKSIVCIRGEVASFIPEKILNKHSCIDIVLRMENDFTLVHLLTYLNNENEIDSIPNISYRFDENVVNNPLVTEVSDLNILPTHNRELYDLKKYYNRDSETIVRSSRGCPSNCAFCVRTKLSKFRLFNIDRFCDEIEFLLKKGFKSFFFSDDTFAFSQRRIDDFLDEVKKRKLDIRFTSNLRIRDISESRILSLKEAGAYRVFVGIETINSSSSEKIKKNLSREFIEEKIAILKKHKLEYHASFILGSPGDTEEDLIETIKFVKKIQPTLVTFNQLRLFPGTPIYEDPEKYEIIYEDKDWFENEEWISRPLIGTKQIPPSKMDYWSRRMLYEFIN